MEPFPFPASKAAQWTHMFIAYESLEFFATQQSTGNGFPNREITFVICACETLEPLDNRRTAFGALAERRALRHVFVRVKVFGLPDDVVRELAYVAHERVTRLLRLYLDAHRFDAFALGHCRQIFFRLLTGGFASINLQPSGRDENFPLR